MKKKKNQELMEIREKRRRILALLLCPPAWVYESGYALDLSLNHTSGKQSYRMKYGILSGVFYTRICFVFKSLLFCILFNYLITFADMNLFSFILFLTFISLHTKQKTWSCIMHKNIQTHIPYTKKVALSMNIVHYRS